MLDPFQLEKYFERLPHRRDLVLFDSIIEATSDSVVCSGVSRNPSGSKGANNYHSVSSLSGVEYIAQAAGLGKIIDADNKKHHILQKGAVIRLRDMKLHQERIPLNERILTYASWSSSVQGAFDVRGRIVLEADSSLIIMEGRLMIVEFE
ncbi:MAG TPA: hypothetical protein PKA63_14475 [Oligoflexia bacterium]|nr:hypothetical protein [Oligoflexia bacterium]HMP49871.1 hypothetical protein [Oligoflexia bacterium]